MRFEGLGATADLVGRRLWVSWVYALDALETPADVPPVTLRRKERDFAYPPPVPGDPYTVYDSTAFPPAPVPGVLQVIDLPPWETVEDGRRVAASAISVAAIIAGVAQEVLRRVVFTTFSPDAVPVAVRVELLDAGGLEPGTPYYYQLDDGGLPPAAERGPFRGVAVAGDTHGSNRRLYDLLPEVYKRHDVRTPPAEAVLSGVPEASPAGGQVRRFMDLFGMGVDALRSSAEGLLNLRDGHRMEARFLVAASRMVGWEPSATLEIPAQRNELLTATRLFDVVGTVPALRALVTHQTGWHCQVAELAQHVARANHAPRRSLYAAEELPSGGWHGALDAAPLFAFSAAGASGAGGLPAVLTSANLEPFALRAGAELTLTVDGGVPARIRFGPDDFANVGAAAAGEVAAAVSRAFDGLIARAVAGAVELTTHAVGPGAALRVETAATSLLALSDAAAGPLSAFADGDGRLRVFYEGRQETGWTEQATFPAGAPHTAGVAEPPAHRLFYKSWGYGEWRDAERLPEWVGQARRPGAAEHADGRIWLAWIDASRPAAWRLRFTLGERRAATPAVVTGLAGERFNLQPGSQLTLRGPFGSETFTVVVGDYGDPAAATAAEVVAAMSAQLTQVTASQVAGGALRLATVASGDRQFLRVDLAQSTAARSLGFGSRRLRGRGAWNPRIDWAGPLAGPPVRGPVTDPSVVRDPLGGMRCFWCEHHAGRWQVKQAHWSERLQAATAAGLAQRTAGGWQVWQMADGLPSDDVRAVAEDADGSLWIATPAGLGSRRPDGVFATLTTGDGLISDDVLDVALLADGALWCATPAGVAIRFPDGTLASVTAGTSDLASDDVRAVASDGLGGAWVATAAAVQHVAAGVWRTWTAADGLAGAPEQIAVAGDGRVAVATDAGVSVRQAGTWTPFTTADGLPSDDVRGAVWREDGTLAAATAAGLAAWDGRTWSTRTTADGLPTNDLRAVTSTPDGELLLGTAAGVAFGDGGSWTIESSADGLPADLVVGVRTAWSAPRILAAGEGGHREPRAAVDAGDRTWLVWARRAGAAAVSRPTWTLRFRRFDPAAAVWDWEPEQALTAAPVDGAADREPWLEPAGGGDYRVFFSSDRGGGRGLWAVSLSATGVAGAPQEALPPAAAEATAPAALSGPAGRTWLFYRTDASLAPSQVSTLPAPGDGPRGSVRVPDAGALRLRGGCRAPVLAHAARNLGRRRWGDLFTYTPEVPHLVSEEAPSQDHLYTRRTLALYLRRARTGQSITALQVNRLQRLLERFLPINLRVVLIVAPEPWVEEVYGDGADLLDAYQDVVPQVEVLTGLADSTAAALPDWALLVSNDLTSLSAALSDLTTFRGRTWFPDLA